MKTRNNPITKTFTIGEEVVERTVTVVETTDYDERGNEIHRNLCDGYEAWREFDERGNQTYSRDLKSGGNTTRTATKSTARIPMAAERAAFVLHRLRVSGKFQLK